MNLKTNIDAAKVKKYGKSKHALTTAEQTAIFKESLITTQPILDKVTNLLDYVVEANKTTPVVYDEVGFKALLNARWQTNTSDDRKAYDVIEKNDKWAKEAINKLASANDFDVSKAKSWAKSQFPSDTAIFDHAGLTTADSIRRAASLLNYVKRAEATSGKNANILGKLTTAKNQSNKSAYNAVNGSSGRVDKAITKLERKKNNNNDSAEIERLKSQVATAKTEKEEADRKFRKKEKEFDDYLKNVLVPSSIEAKKYTERSAAIKKVIEDVKASKDKLKSVMDDSFDIAALMEGFGTAVSTSVEDVNRRYIAATAHYDAMDLVLTNLNTFLSSIKDDKLDLALQEQFTVNGVVNEAKVASAKEAITDFKTIWKQYDDLEEIRQSVSLQIAKENGYKTIEEMKAAINKSYSGEGINLGETHRKAIKEMKRWEEHEKFGECAQKRLQTFVALSKVLNEVFPLNSYQNSPLLDVTKDFADKNTLTKIYPVNWAGRSTMPNARELLHSVNPQEKAIRINLSFGVTKDNHGIAKKEGFVKFIWSLFNNKNTALNVVDYSISRSYKTLQLFKTYKYRPIEEYEYKLLLDDYLAEIETILEAAKDSNGKSLGLKLDDKWKEAATKVFDRAKNSYLRQREKIRKSLDANWKWFGETYEDSVDLEDYDLFFKTAEAEANAKEERQKRNQRRLDKLGDARDIAETEAEEKVKNLTMLEEQLRDAEGLDLEGKKNKFKAIYRDGPRSGSPDILLYSLQELKSMEYYLGLILEDKDADDATKIEFRGYGQNIENEVNLPIASYLATHEKEKHDYEKWVALEGTAEERRDELFVSLSQEDKKLALEGIKRVYEYIEKRRKLSAPEGMLLKQINEILTGKKEEEEQNIDEWKKIFPGETWLTDDIITKWKATNNFKTKEEFKKLVENIYKDGVFLTYLKDKRKMTGVETWEDLIKQEPTTVIGVILYYNQIIKDKGGDQQEAAKAALRKEMKNDEATVSEMEKYLADKAEAKKKKSSSTSEEKTFWEKPAGKITLVVGGFVVLGIIGAVIFWDSIKAWWENTGEEETKKPSKKNK